MSEELKPCPFCGADVDIVKQKYLKNGYKSCYIFHPVSNCVLSSKMTRIFESEEQAVRMWNRRT